MKVMRRSQLMKRRTSLVRFGPADEDFRREFALIKRIRHRNLVSLYDVIDDASSDRIYLGIIFWSFYCVANLTIPLTFLPFFCSHGVYGMWTAHACAHAFDTAAARERPPVLSR
jgi:hypothetical protein